MDCNLLIYLKNNEHKELKAFGLPSLIPVSPEIFSDKKRRSTELENPGIYKCHTHTNTHREKKVDRAQQGGTERMRDYQTGNQNTTFNWIIARYPKAGSQ